MPATADSKPIEILLVEDNEGDVYLLKTSFADAKIPNRIHVAEDGAQALSMLSKQAPYESFVTPDIILLDINLPKVNGRDVLDKVKNDPNLCNIPVIVLSSSNVPDDILEVYNLRANSFVTKPADLDNFIEVARAIEDFWMGIVKLPTKVK